MCLTRLAPAAAQFTCHVTDAATEIPTINPPENTENKETAPPAANAPLAPPPKPSQNGDSDYFANGPNASHLTKEPNPFESAFSNPAETPGKTQLPGVTSLTSPASLLPGNTPGWPGSLRSGPLSPAMLTGPTGSNDYFNSDHHFAGSFPTPNESSLRTGLTPGGGGSMFPQPSPNSQALYNSLQSGGATPGTLDFHRTAMTARAQTNAANAYGALNPSTSQAQQNPNIQPDLDSKPYNPNGQSVQQDNQDPFGSHQSNEAANGLFMLAQAGGQQRNATSYPMQSQPQQQYQQGAQQDQRGKGSIGSNISGSTEGADQYSEEDGKTQSRSTRGKKGAAGKGTANGKRKTDDTTAKGPASKRARGNTISEEPEDDDMSQDGDNGGNGDKKMTDEEKRKNFLERNRYVLSLGAFDALLTLPALPLLNADSARSNGWPTFNRRLKSLAQKTMHLRLQLRSCAKRLLA